MIFQLNARHAREVSPARVSVGQARPPPVTVKLIAPYPPFPPCAPSEGQCLPHQHCQPPCRRQKSPCRSPWASEIPSHNADKAPPPRAVACDSLHTPHAPATHKIRQKSAAPAAPESLPSPPTAPPSPTTTDTTAPAQ